MNSKILRRIVGPLFINIFFLGTAQGTDWEQSKVDQLKLEIIDLAQSFSGQGDPDFSRQQALEVLVNELIRLSPQPPVEQRLGLLYGVWKQVWGPYDYRNSGRGVDPSIGTDEIYQVIFPEGYYYNVSPNYPEGNRAQERVSLLRGEFKLSTRSDNELDVRFTEYPGVDPRPQGVSLWELPAAAESGQLENRITIVPTWIVKLFFSPGSLEEVYTDDDLRILYGKTSTNFREKYIYIMTRIQ
jgi:hypothetical protein